MKRALEDKDR